MKFGNMCLATFIWYMLLGFAHSKLNIKRPLNGLGKILISSFDSHDHYNEDKLMVKFSLTCLQSNNNDYDSIIKEKMDMFEEKYKCLKHDNHKHFKQNDKIFSFLNINKNEKNCIHNANIELNYNEHCIDMFLHEPVLHLQANSIECTVQNITNSAFANNWGLDYISAPRNDGMYSYPSTLETIDNGVDLVIVDSGVRDSHVEFNNGQVIHKLGNGPPTTETYNETSNTTTITYASHGTHVAGIAAGINYGASKGTKIYDYQVCSDMCPTYLIWLAYDSILNDLSDSNGIYYNRRIVINFSVGGYRTIFEIYEYYFKEIHALGGIIAAAAGNEAVHSCEVSPAFSEYAFSVGAYDVNLTASSFTNFGECNDIWAPGVSIYSATADTDTSYDSWDGTSMASPYIAGIVYNILYTNPTLTFNQIKYILYENHYNVQNCYEHESGPETCYAASYGCNSSNTYENVPEYIVNYTDIPFDVYVPNNNNPKCSTLIVDEYVTHNNTFSKRNLLAINQCYSSKEDVEEISWIYQCDYDKNEINVTFYDSSQCETEGVQLQTISDGYFDGKYKYFVNCNPEAETNDNLYCNIRFRYYYPEIYTNCSNWNTSTYSEDYVLNDFCLNDIDNTSSMIFTCDYDNDRIWRKYYHGGGCLEENIKVNDTTVSYLEAYCWNDYGYYEANTCPEQIPPSNTEQLTSTTASVVATDKQTIDTTVANTASINILHAIEFFVLCSAWILLN
eukprot:485314_1